MSALEVERLRLRLLARRDDLMADTDTAADAANTVELDQARVGRLTRMDALQQQAMSRENQRRRTRELKRIDQALRRIKDDEYGYCVECGEEIAENRLAVDPAAPLCIGCASEREKGPG